MKTLSLIIAAFLLGCTSRDVYEWIRAYRAKQHCSRVGSAQCNPVNDMGEFV